MIILGDLVLVHQFDQNLGLIVVRNSDDVVLVRVLATALADFTVDSLFTDDESAVRVHLCEDVGVVGKISFNRSENNRSGHCNELKNNDCCCRNRRFVFK